MSKKEKFPLYLSPEKKAILERRYQEDGSRSMTAFIARAVDFYLDYLSANDAGLFLPTSIKSGLSMLFKCVNVSEEELRRQRAESVANVKKANGKVSLVQKLRELEDDPWQD